MLSTPERKVLDTISRSGSISANALEIHFQELTVAAGGMPPAHLHPVLHSLRTKQLITIVPGKRSAKLQLTSGGEAALREANS